MSRSLHHWLFMLLALLAGAGRAVAQVQTVFTASGLASVQYQGAEFVASGAVQAGVILQNPAGTRYEVGPVQSVFDLVQKRRTITYPWGSVTVTYVTAGSRLTFQVAVANNSADPIVECAVTLLAAQFPSLPAGFAWASGFEVADLNIDDLTALPADYGSGLLVLCNDQPGVPLKFGFTSPDSGAENTAAAAANDADPDGDGFTNFFEFALGLDPTARDLAAKVPHVHAITADGADWLALTFRRRRAVPPGVSYVVEESTDLVSWSIVDEATHQIGPPADQLDGTETVTIRGTHPLGTARIFLRLRVSEP